jgi:hypothetical protein
VGATADFHSAACVLSSVTASKPTADFLLRLDVPKRGRAWLLALSGKGWCRRSRSRMGTPGGVRSYDREGSPYAIAAHLETVSVGSPFCWRHAHEQLASNGLRFVLAGPRE